MISDPKTAFAQIHATCDSSCRSGKIAIHSMPKDILAQIKDFFSNIVSTADWPPRWHCGYWSEFHGWLYLLSDIAIGTAYFAIPFLLFRMLRNRKDIPFPRIIWLFIAFILLCGTTHFLDAAIFWWPAYRLSAIIRFLTATISIFTLFALYKILPLIYKLRTQEQLEVEIEERKKAEEEARAAAILKKAAEDLMAKKDEFMSIASHELKTPITSVKASLQLLEKMADKNEPIDKVAPFIRKSVTQTNKLTRIINDLLDVNKITAGRLVLNKSDFDILILVAECVEQCHLITNRIANVNGPQNLIVHADRSKIEQVITNLLLNAFKYSAINEPVMIYIETFSEGIVRVIIEDHGIGIPEDKIEHVFDRFYRVENNSQQYSGVGLGLYISSEIIRQHGGNIGAKSIVGHGATFWFTL